MGLVERAIQIAREGDCQSIYAIQLKLAREGYSDVSAHFVGISFRRQISSLLRISRRVCFTDAVAE